MPRWVYILIGILALLAILWFIGVRFTVSA